MLHWIATAERHGVVLAELARTLLWLFANPEATETERAAQLGSLCAAVEAAWGIGAVEPFLAYLLSAFVRDTPIRDKLLNAAPPQASEMFVTMRQAFEAEGEARGRAEGAQRMLLRAIEARGLRLDDRQRARIATCRDEARLGRWLERCMVAQSAEAIFDDHT